MAFRFSGRWALLCAAGLCSWGASARGHELWIEQNGQGAFLRFGEYAANLQEASPGYLDKLTSPSAWLETGRGKARSVSLQRGELGLRLARPASPGESLAVVDRGYPLLEGRGAGARRAVWTPAARCLASLEAPVSNPLTLDVLPVGSQGRFKVLFRGRPLPHTEVALTAESGWSLHEYSDEQGLVSFTMPWRGSYLVHVRHEEEKGGRRGTEAFDVASFSTSVAFSMPNGLKGPRRPERKPPNAVPEAQQPGEKAR